jgi:[protein-PII] uridylyltransferase
VAEKDYQPLWDKLGRPYFLRHESQEIAWHTRLLLSHLNSETPIVRARLSPDGGGIQVMIYTRDRDDLFARICGFFERAGYNIVEANIHTTLHGYALDSFLVLDQSDKSVRYRDLLSYIEYEITQRLSTNNKLEVPLVGRISRQVKHLPIKPVVSIASETKSNHHQLNIVAGDRPGLLSNIAHTFLQHDVHLHMAKINTLGNRAEDTFLISARDGKKLTEDTLKTLEEELLGQL